MAKKEIQAASSALNDAGQSPLWLAAWEGDLEAVRRCLTLEGLLDLQASVYSAATVQGCWVCRQAGRVCYLHSCLHPSSSQCSVGGAHSHALLCLLLSGLQPAGRALSHFPHTSLTLLSPFPHSHRPSLTLLSHFSHTSLTLPGHHSHFSHTSLTLPSHFPHILPGHHSHHPRLQVSPIP